MENKPVNQDQIPKKDIDPDVVKYVERQKKEVEKEKLLKARQKAEQNKYQSNYGKTYI